LRRTKSGAKKFEAELRTINRDALEIVNRKRVVAGMRASTGIINEDKLGLDIIYVQAKRWDVRRKNALRNFRD
jgi:restriction endonuclease Mrr